MNDPGSDIDTKVDVPKEYWDNMFAPPTGVTIETTLNPDGSVNAAPHATCVRVTHAPVQIAMTVNDYSHTARNVLETGEFVVNPVAFDRRMLEKVRIVGLPFESGVDELERAGLRTLPSREVGPPRIADCRIHFECRVEWTHHWGPRLMVCGTVVAVSIDRDCYDEATGQVLFDRLRPAQFCGAAYEGMFVPTYEPIRVDVPYDGPLDWRKDLAETKKRLGIDFPGAVAELEGRS